MPPSRTRETHGFGIEPARAKPVAVITPDEQAQVIGARIRLDGRGSTTSDNLELSYTWSFISVPLGSAVADAGFENLDDDGSVVSFAPDITGLYTIGLVASTPYRSSDQVQGTVTVQAVLTPYTSQATPDGAFMFKVISDFWRLVNNREMFPVLWSGMIQIHADNLLRLFQTDYAKSIANIQDLYQRRWLKYSPKVDLAADQHYAIFGNHQSGSGAFTGTSLGAASGVIISSREFVLFEGQVTSEAIGTDLTIYSSRGGNIGTYTVNRLNSDGSGYVVSAATPFPAPTDELLTSDTDLVSTALSSQVYAGTSTTSFVDLGVLVGDVLRIESGSDADYYIITKVGVADGLTNDRTLEISEELTKTKTNLSYSIFRPNRAGVTRLSASYTDTVYIPQPDADLTVYETAELTGDGEIVNVFEITVASRHVFDALVGKSITITSGTNGGKSFIVAAVNDSRTGYIISTSFGGSFPQTVTYEIPLLADISDRLLVLDGETYELISVALDTSQPSVEDGGRGPLWVLTLKEALAPAGLENLSWRIAATLVSEELDFESLGVRYGDLLWMEVERTDTRRIAKVPCVVFGCVDNRLSFDVGTTLPADGANGSFTDDELVELAQEWALQRVSIDEVTNELQVLYVAEVVQDTLESLAFQNETYNLPIESTSDIDVTAFIARVRAARVIRNSRIDIAEEVESIPALFEYIARPVYGTDADGNMVLLTKDGATTTLDRAPLTLVENSDYIISDEELSGEDAETTADSGLIKIPHGDLRDRDVRPGDTLDLLSGYDEGRYTILAILDSENIRVIGEAGGLPGTTATGVQYLITRKHVGYYLRFIEGLFSPSSPAPDDLWAETTFFDNSDYIEDNFGLMVGITREQLDEYGSSQVSYKGAVSALMFAWANGPTLANIGLGTHILLGLPVTEVAGVITDIDDSYTADTGRILIEDTDPDGTRRGVVRVYYYRRLTEDVLPEFAGVATNPDTGTSYAIGDTVTPFRPLSNGVVVDDYVKTPAWWQVGETLTGRELEKFHTWQVQVDAGAVDSRDMSLVVDFLMAIRPIYTKPSIALVLYLSDDVTVEDDISFEADLLLYDDPAFSLASTHMVDDYNGGSLPLRITDVGSFGARTLFEGHDLVTEDGSDIVVSARGGFVSEFNGAINDSFPDLINTRGSKLIRVGGATVGPPFPNGFPGDILYIVEGPNVGRYEIIQVTDDNTLRVRQMGGTPTLPAFLPPASPDPANIVAGSGQRFYIERLNQAVVAWGNDLSTTSGSSTVTSAGANFLVDGVSTDDVLVIGTSLCSGRYRILEVLRATSGTQNSTQLVLNKPMPANAGGAFYQIERPTLFTNPLYTTSLAATTAGSPIIVLPGSPWNALLLPVHTGDWLRIISSPVAADVGRVLKVVGVISSTQLLLDPSTVPIGNAAGVTIEIFRTGLDESIADTDRALEFLWTVDEFWIEVCHPRTLFLSVADGSLAAGVYADPMVDFGVAHSAGTNLQTAGVTTAMSLYVRSGTSSGVYKITSVVGNDVEVDSLFFENDVGPLTLDFLTDPLEFQLLNNTVTSLSGLNLTGAGPAGFAVLPGDYFVCSLGTFLIAGGAGPVLNLASSTGVNPAANYAGKILRRRVT